MTQPPAGPELARLARTLDADPAVLSMLAPMPDDDLRRLRTLVSAALSEVDRPHFGRVAALAQTLPAAVSARFTELVLPPLLSARTAELLRPDRVADLASRLSVRYLADVAAVLDPDRTAVIIAAVPAALVAGVADELARRSEWVVISSFVSTVGEDALAAAIARFDGPQLLHVGYLVDEPGRLDAIGTLLTGHQVEEMLAAAAGGLWAEFATVFDGMSDGRVARFAGRYRSAPAAVRSAFEAAAGHELDAAVVAALAGGTRTP